MRRIVISGRHGGGGMRLLYDARIALTFLAGFGLGALLALVFLAFDVARMLGTEG
jgi:hypothetical protein